MLHVRNYCVPDMFIYNYDTYQKIQEFGKRTWNWLAYKSINARYTVREINIFIISRKTAWNMMCLRLLQQDSVTVQLTRANHDPPLHPSNCAGLNRDWYRPRRQFTLHRIINSMCCGQGLSCTTIKEKRVSTVC